MKKKVWLAVTVILFLMNGWVHAVTNPVYSIGMPIFGSPYKRIIFEGTGISFPIDGSKLSEYILALCLETTKTIACGGSWGAEAVDGGFSGIKLGNGIRKHISIYLENDEITVKTDIDGVAHYIKQRKDADVVEMRNFEYVLAGCITFFTNCQSENIGFDITEDHYSFTISFY